MLNNVKKMLVWKIALSKELARKSCAQLLLAMYILWSKGGFDMNTCYGLYCYILLLTDIFYYIKDLGQLWGQNRVSLKKIAKLHLHQATCKFKLMGRKARKMIFGIIYCVIYKTFFMETERYGFLTPSQTTCA